MIVQKLDMRVVKLIPEQIVMESEKVLTQYFITTWSLTYRNKRKPEVSLFNYSSAF